MCLWYVRYVRVLCGRQLSEMTVFLRREIKFLDGRRCVIRAQGKVPI